MDRFELERPGEAEPDPETEENRLVADMGMQHERAYLARLKELGGDVCEIPESGDRAGQTLAAMRTGRQVIYQASLSQAPFSGYADYLVRVAGPSKFGDYHYEPWDTKLALKPRPYFLIQLCAYASMLEHMQGKRPERIRVVLGNHEERDFRTDDYFYYFLMLRQQFEAWMANFDPARRPEPEPGISHGRWSSLADRFFEETDHLARVAGISLLQIKRLRSDGIQTLAALAAATLTRVSRMADSTYQRLRTQAKLQRSSRAEGKLSYEIVAPEPSDPRKGLALLPPSSPNDIYFDMEGYPFLEGGLEYLFGSITVDQGNETFHDWWAHDRAEEKDAFSTFVDWAHDCWRSDPKMHIYHYAAYEVSALRRLMGRHGTRETKVDDLLRNEVFVDLLNVVRQGVRVGSLGYSIKDLEPLYQPPRAGDVKSAGGSIVAYQRWRESGEPKDPKASPLLRSIREYNRDDCSSLYGLVRWLRDRQKESGIAYIPRPKIEIEDKPSAPAPGSDQHPREVLAATLLSTIPSDRDQRSADPERWRIQELLAHLLGFHRREAKPVFWAMFDRHAMSTEELVDDPTCLGDLKRTAEPPMAIKRSKGYAYTFDPDQDTKIEAESKCFFAHDLRIKTEVHEFDRENGRIVIKLGNTALALLPGSEPPRRLSLIPDEYVSSVPQQAAIEALATRWQQGAGLPPALADLLKRSPPRIRGHAGGPLVETGESPSDAAVRAALDLDGSILCIQGPPGAGKTRTGAKIANAYLAKGRRVGIVANSHKAVLNLMKACGTEAGGFGGFVKVGGGANDPMLSECPGSTYAESSSDGAAAARGARLVGGTSWLFARDDVADLFDVLLVDEAGQMALANLVSMSRCAKNIVLLGDQMQLGQPTQGTHPGESGQSCLDYLLRGQATIPEELGIFLSTTHRLHPKVCGLISGAFYEGRLFPEPHTVHRVVRVPPNQQGRVWHDAGILFIPVEHEGNAQCSDEEVEVIGEIVRELVGRELTNEKGSPAGRLRLEEVLFVAPYNMQVRRLKAALESGARVASVDKFQGQQAPVVVVSMCTSSGDLSTRGIEFLFDRKRLNVAVSRAWSLAIVVGCPALATTGVATIEQMNLVNTFCRIMLEGKPAVGEEARA